jgi:hypothetical protein
MYLTGMECNLPHSYRVIFKCVATNEKEWRDALLHFLMHHTGRQYPRVATFGLPTTGSGFGFEKSYSSLSRLFPFTKEPYSRSAFMRPQLMYPHHEIKEKDLVLAFHLTEDLIKPLHRKDD